MLRRLVGWLALVTGGSGTATCKRLLLDSLTREARRHGFRSHHVIAFVRRKAGPDLSVWRQLSDGAVGCAAPCVLCHRAICNFGLRVHCPLLDGTWFSGRLTDDGAPPGVATSGQARAFKFGVDSDTKRRSKVKATAAGVAAAGVSSGKGSGGCSADDGACDGRKSSGRGQSEVGAGSDACCTSKQRSQLQRQVRGRQKQQEQQLGRRKGGVPVGPLGQRPLIWCVGNTEHITCVPDTGDGREGAKARPPRL
ncbi:MAG: hypothetical protein WDW36_008990 [Sanguina aurantia]